MTKLSENSDPSSSRLPAAVAGDPACEILKTSKTIAVVGLSGRATVRVMAWPNICNPLDTA